MADNGARHSRDLSYGTGMFETPRVWTTAFLVRHVAVALFALSFAVFPQFGDDRLWLAGVTLFVIPYDVVLHLYARRERKLPRHMLVAYAVVPPAIAALFPLGWIPALGAAVANLGLFAAMFPLRDALFSTALGGVAFVVAGLVGDPLGFVPGLVTYALAAPALVIVVSKLFDAARASEKRYRDFVDNASDIVYTHDLETLTFTSVNQAALRLTGYTREEIGEITVADVVAPEDLGRAAEMIQRKIAGEADTTTYELEILTKDGRRLPVEVSTRIIHRRGEPVAVQGIARDISERKQVEEQRAALDRARTEFIANAAHELRTPLTTLAGLAAVLATTRRRMSEAELDEAISALNRQGRRARILADRLLDLSSVELGRMAIVREPVTVRDVVERTLEDAPPPEDKDVVVAIDDDLQALTDAARLEQILANLLTNAYRYGGPHVVVGARTCDGDTIEIEVRDDGPGVPEELVEELFEPFARASSTARRRGSTGLGLPICARVAAALDGEISYRPASPAGASFRIRIPAA